MQLQGSKPARKQERPSKLFSSLAASYQDKYEDFSDEIEYLGYLVRPCLAVATGVGLPEVLVALVQFGRDDQIAWQEQHTQKHLN